MLESGILLNKAGEINSTYQNITVQAKSKRITVSAIGVRADEYLENTSPYMSVKLDRPVAFYTGKTQTIEQVKNIVGEKRNELVQQSKQY